MAEHEQRLRLTLERFVDVGQVVVSLDSSQLVARRTLGSAEPEPPLRVNDADALMEVAERSLAGGSGHVPPGSAIRSLSTPRRGHSPERVRRPAAGSRRGRLDNLVLLCSHHHRLVHEDGFGVARTAGGALLFRRPDGRALPTVPSPPPGSAAELRARNRTAKLRVVPG
jgi:hypothetical protein